MNIPSPSDPSREVPPAYVSPSVERPMTPQIVIQQHDGRWSRWVSWLGWMGFLVTLPMLIGYGVRYQEYFDTSQGIQERFALGSQTAKNKIAIVDVTGLIMEGDGFVKKQINRIRNDAAIKAVVLRIDSPGGTVTGSDFIYHHLVKLRKDKELPMVVSMGSLAASGGYYVAMAVGDQEDSIFAEPTTTTGSIGVIIPHYDVSGLMERLDIKDDSIVSHPRKQLLSMTRRASEEDRAVMQSYVDATFERFKSIVQAGRPKFRERAEDLKRLATGEVFTAEKAKEEGLVDRIGFLEDAVARAAELAGLQNQNVRVVRYKPQPTVLDALGVEATASARESELLRLGTPRAYYLWSNALPQLRMLLP